MNTCEISAILEDMNGIVGRLKRCNAVLDLILIEMATDPLSDAVAGVSAMVESISDNLEADIGCVKDYLDKMKGQSLLSAIRDDFRSNIDVSKDYQEEPGTTVIQCQDCIHYGECGDCDIHPHDGRFNRNYFCADAERDLEPSEEDQQENDTVSDIDVAEDIPKEHENKEE